MNKFQTYGLLAGSAIFVGLFVFACSDDETKPSQAVSADAGTDGNVTVPPLVDAGVEPVSCEAYCTRVMGNCVGSLKQYENEFECLKMCRQLPLGTGADQQGNTVGCRHYHAAAVPQTIHCPHAGPYGGGMCGASRCEAFCTMALSTCGTDGGAFTSRAQCDQACATDPEFRFDVDAGETFNAPQQGRNLNCREYHLRAAQSNAAIHCLHIGLRPDGGSGDPCF